MISKHISLAPHTYCGGRHRGEGPEQDPLNDRTKEALLPLARSKEGIVISLVLATITWVLSELLIGLSTALLLL